MVCRQGLETQPVTLWPGDLGLLGVLYRMPVKCERQGFGVDMSQRLKALRFMSEGVAPPKAGVRGDDPEGGHAYSC